MRLFCFQLLFWFAKTKKSAVSQGRADRHTDFRSTAMMEAAAKPDTRTTEPRRSVLRAEVKARKGGTKLTAVFQGGGKKLIGLAQLLE